MLPSIVQVRDAFNTLCFIRTEWLAITIDSFYIRIHLNQHTPLFYKMNRMGNDHEFYNNFLNLILKCFKNIYKIQFISAE